MLNKNEMIYRVTLHLLLENIHLIIRYKNLSCHHHLSYHFKIMLSLYIYFNSSIVIIYIIKNYLKNITNI